MRLLFILSILTIACFASGQTNQNNIPHVRYDGFYQTVSDISKEDNDTSYSYLRFYPDGRVISVTSEGTAYDLRDWFNLEMHDSSVGKYEIRGKRLYFSTTNNSGTVIYSGKIRDQYHLYLKAKSLVNGYKDRGKILLHRDSGLEMNRETVWKFRDATNKFRFLKFSNLALNRQNEQLTSLQKRG